MSNSRSAMATPTMGPVSIQAPLAGRKEVRCAVRFPLALPVVLSGMSGELFASTKNVSANGVLFEVNKALEVGSDIRFSLRMPGPVLGSSHDVLVECEGRVVRCSISNIQYLAAATIDDYRFCEQ